MVYLNRRPTNWPQRVSLTPGDVATECLRAFCGLVKKSDRCAMAWRICSRIRNFCSNKLRVCLNASGSVRFVRIGYLPISSRTPSIVLPKCHSDIPPSRPAISRHFRNHGALGSAAKPLLQDSKSVKAARKSSVYSMRRLSEIDTFQAMSISSPDSPSVMRKGGLSIDDLGFGMASANKQNHEDREIAERMERGRRFLNTPPQPHGKNPNHHRLQSPK